MKLQTNYLRYWELVNEDSLDAYLRQTKIPERVILPQIQPIAVLGAIVSPRLRLRVRPARQLGVAVGGFAALDFQ